MKKILLLVSFLIISVYCLAQQQLAFPFQGGSTAMTQFFKDSIAVSPEIIKSKATGTVVFKFTADQKGTIQKLVIYYADDAILAPPLIEALKKSNHHWVVPDNEKSHDFILSFAISFNPPAQGTPSPQKGVYNFYLKRKPILSMNQVPLDNVTLLPAVLVKYSID
ncbi:MAG TPA: hypothetical protein VK671_06305 [Mucilaginibacter sp.]|jgi:hypothetical protein|nr:hypothetical protein [Mucilaginibacter sp.]